MEITASPPPGRGHRTLVRVLLLLAVALAVALLTPAALGLSMHAVGDDAMSDSHPRGSLVLAESVQAEELAVGDVITFRPPVGDGDGPWVTRRVVDIEGDLLVTQAQARPDPDPWLLTPGEPELQQVTRTLPWLGYPWLAAAAIGPLLGGLLLGAVLLLVLAVRRRSRAAAPARTSDRPRAAPDARVTLV